MQRYRFGSRLYTEDEIRQIADQHGCDEILFYPPSRWGSQASTAGGATAPGTRPVRLHPMTPLDQIYLDSYRAGYYRRFS